MYRIALFIIIVIGLAARYEILDEHFAHCDDLVVSSVIHNSNEGELLKRLNKRLETDNNIVINSIKGNESLKNILSNILGPIDDSPFIGRITHKMVITPLFMMYTTSYAPIQFTLTSLLLNNEMNYKETKFYSRLPSFLIYILTLIFLWIFFSRISIDEFVTQATISCLILSISWEHIIFSAQSESYSIAILAALISLILIDIVAKQRTNSSFLVQIVLGLAFSALMFMNYQLIFFMPSLFFVLLLYHKTNLLSFFKQHWVSISVSFFFWILAIGIVSFLGRGGIHWNTGPNMEYYFSLQAEWNMLQIMYYLLSFFTSNFYLVFKFLISPFHYESVFNDFYTVVLIIFFFGGIYSFLTGSDKVKKHISFYFFGVTMTWIIMICSQNLTFSPTRHSLIFLIFILVFVPEGVIFLFKISKINKWYLKLSFFISGTILLIGFKQSFDSIFLKRIDPFDENKVEELMQLYSVTDLYAYSWTNNFNSMNHIKKNYFTKTLGNTNYFWKSDKDEDDLTVIMFSSSRETEYYMDPIIQNHLCEKFNYSLPKFKTVYSMRKDSEEEVDYGNYTENGTNGQFIDIVEIIQSENLSTTNENLFFQCNKLKDASY
jgi:hypothetical protein